jgi:CheY-specific phosphatase CheX
MASNLPNALAKTALLVLENWAMMMVEPLEKKPEFSELQPLLVAKIHFRGVLGGTVSILTQRGFAETLTRTIAGADEDDVIELSDIMDALKEMTNVLTGNFLTEAYGDDTVFDIILPTVIEVPLTEIATHTTSKATCFFKADDQPIGFTFALDTES